MIGSFVIVPWFISGICSGTVRGTGGTEGGQEESKKIVLVDLHHHKKLEKEKHEGSLMYFSLSTMSSLVIYNCNYKFHSMEQLH